MIDPSEKEITTKEMLDTLEHCRVNMALGVVQAYAGKWTERDERTIDTILRLIEASDKGPEVDEGFVQRFVQELCDWAGEERGSWQDAENIVFANLREAGVKVKEEK